MSRATTIGDLEHRQSQLRAVALLLAGGAAFSAAAFVLMLQPGASGPPDVHVPPGVDGLLKGLPAAVFAQQVHIAGGALATFQSRFMTFLTILAFGSFLLLVWASWKGRKDLVRPAAVCLVALLALRPVSPPVQLDPPRAVSAPFARQLLALPPGQWRAENDPTAVPELRYMLAQIAFIEGDRARAARYAAGIDANAHLASRIEAPYRVEYMQGRTPGRSTICFMQGCLPTPVRLFLLFLLGAGVPLLLALTGGAIWLRRRLARRCARIAELGEMVRPRQRTFA